MIRISDVTSLRIRNMSLFCSFLVVSIHCHWQPETCFHKCFSHGIALMAVPYFFIVSGFFLARHFDDNNYWSSEVKKRLKSLVVPFYLWSGVYVLSYAGMSIIADMFAHRPLGTSIYIPNLIYLLGLDFTQPNITPLWYIRSLFVFVLFCGAFKKFVNVIPRLEYLLIAIILAGTVSVFLPEGMVRKILTAGIYPPDCNPLLGAVYFTIGIYMQRHKVDLDSCRKSYSLACGIVGFALVLFAYVYAQNHLQNMALVVAVPLLIYFTWCFMPIVKLPNWLATSSFPIYVSHIIFVVFLELFMKHITFNPWLQSFLVYLLSIFGSIATTWMLRSLFPKWANLLFGGR